MKNNSKSNGKSTVNPKKGATVKGCQRLSDEKKIIDGLLKKSKILEEDVKGLSPTGMKFLYAHIQNELNGATKENLEYRMAKYYQVIPEDSKNQIWDNNHVNIISSMFECIKTSGIFPTKTLIANKTGLSRTTVQKHLDRYPDSDLNKFFIQSKFMIEQKLLGTLLFHASHGDVKSARLYMEATGMINSSTTSGGGKADQNFIQINGTTINQTFINQLPSDLLNQLEQMISRKDQNLPPISFDK